MGLFSNIDSWIDPKDIGSRILPYQPTYKIESFINDNHKFYSFCPVKEDILIDICIPGWLRREDALKLYELAYFANGNILELGCYYGLSTSLLAQAVTDSGDNKFIFSADISPILVTETKKNLKARGLNKNVLLTCIDGEIFCKSNIVHNKIFSFIFIDHSHSYKDVAKICLILPKLLVSGGFVLFHDFNDIRNNDPYNLEFGVSQAVYDNLDSTLFEFYGMFGCTALYRKVIGNG